MAEWTEYPVIWLSPWCEKCEHSGGGRPISEFEGRQWCESPQEPCEDCGKDWSRYGLVKAGESAPDAE